MKKKSEAAEAEKNVLGNNERRDKNRRSDKRHWYFARA
jgi:hypothetical protein